MLELKTLYHLNIFTVGIISKQKLKSMFNFYALKRCNNILLFHICTTSIILQTLLLSDGVVWYQCRNLRILLSSPSRRCSSFISIIFHFCLSYLLPKIQYFRWCLFGIMIISLVHRNEFDQLFCSIAIYVLLCISSSSTSICLKV